MSSWLAHSVVKRDIQNGMHSAYAYVVAVTFVELPYILLLALAILLPTYIIGDWHWPSFCLNTLVMSAFIFAFEAIAQAFSLGSNPVMAIFNLIGLWFQW